MSTFSTTGDAQEVASALGMHGRLQRGDIAVDPPPPGYAIFTIRTLIGSGAAIALKPAGRILTREVFDAAFGAGRDVVRTAESGLQDVAYRIAVAGAPAKCTIIAGFERLDGPAAEILLRRDTFE